MRQGASAARSGRRPWLQAAINGARVRGEHAALPLTPGEQAKAAAACRRAGADAVHAHVRDDDGHETLAPAAVAALVRALRTATLDLPIGVSTGAWIVPDPALRLALVRDWREQPDFASVNFDEQGADELAVALLAQGVGVEAGLASVVAGETFLASGVVSRCLRVLLEPQVAWYRGYSTARAPRRGSCWQRPCAAGIRPASDSRTRCSFPTAGSPRTMRPW